MLLFWYDSGIILAGLHMFSKTLNKMEPLSLPTLELLAKYQNKGRLWVWQLWNFWLRVRDSDHFRSRGYKPANKCCAGGGVEFGREQEARFMQSLAKRQEQTVFYRGLWSCTEASMSGITGAHIAALSVYTHGYALLGILGVVMCECVLVKVATFPSPQHHFMHSGWSPVVGEGTWTNCFWVCQRSLKVPSGANGPRNLWL